MRRALWEIPHWPATTLSAMPARGGGVSATRVLPLSGRRTCTKDTPADGGVRHPRAGAARRATLVLTNAAGGINPPSAGRADGDRRSHQPHGRQPSVGPMTSASARAFPTCRRCTRSGCVAVPTMRRATPACRAPRRLCRRAGPSYETPAEIRAFRPSAPTPWHVHGARGDRGPPHRPRGARALVHHQHGGRCVGRAPHRRGDRDGRRVRGAFMALLEASLPGFRPLVAAARDARRHAMAPYSGFAVGAALEPLRHDRDTGCNIENATYGLTVCASASRSSRPLRRPARFARIAVVADTATPTPPCGACRQLLWEFAGDIECPGQPTRWSAATRRGIFCPPPFDRRLLVTDVLRGWRSGTLRARPGAAAIDRLAGRNHGVSRSASMRRVVSFFIPCFRRSPGDGDVVMVDQRKLPGRGGLRPAATPQRGGAGHHDDGIRGAPAIGVAAAMGLALGMRAEPASGTRKFAVDFNKVCDLLAATRPTAVNLFWAIDR